MKLASTSRIIIVCPWTAFSHFASASASVLPNSRSFSFNPLQGSTDPLVTTVHVTLGITQPLSSVSEIGMAATTLTMSAIPTGSSSSSSAAYVFLPQSSPSSSSSTSTVLASLPSSSSITALQESNDDQEGPAAPGTSFVGDLTWYETGLGSCGIESSYSDHIVAVSHILMQAYPVANPNTNSLCNRMVNIQFNGNTFPATVVDTCEACAEGDLDLSEGFFNVVTGGQAARGRIPGVHWDWAGQQGSSPQGPSQSGSSPQQTSGFKLGGPAKTKKRGCWGRALSNEVQPWWRVIAF